MTTDNITTGVTMHTERERALLEELDRCAAARSATARYIANRVAEREQARDLAVQLENELAELTEAHDHTLAALYQAGIALCECREVYPKHVAGVPGCKRPHDCHEDRRAA